jgi:hypothetical protein
MSRIKSSSVGFSLTFDSIYVWCTKSHRKLSYFQFCHDACFSVLASVSPRSTKRDSEIFFYVYCLYFIFTKINLLFIVPLFIIALLQIFITNSLDGASTFHPPLPDSGRPYHFELWLQEKRKGK